MLIEIRKRRTGLGVLSGIQTPYSMVYISIFPSPVAARKNTSNERNKLSNKRFISFSPAFRPYFCLVPQCNKGWTIRKVMRWGKRPKKFMQGKMSEKKIM